MIRLLFLINLLSVQNADAKEINDKVYKILRDYSPTLQNMNSVTSKSKQNEYEVTTKVDILSVLHDIGTFKQIVDNEKKVIIKDQEDGVKKEVGDKIKKTDELTWFADLLDSPNDIMAKEFTAERKERDHNVTIMNDLKNVLLKLIKVLEDLNKNIVDYNVDDKGNGFMMMKLPLKKHKSRPKRDVDIDNSTSLVINEVVGSPVTLAVANETVITNNTNGSFRSNNTESGSNKNGRRNLYTETPLEVKEKLLAYLNESFREIKIKVEPLNGLKMAFGNNNDYKIGYVIANIDALEANLGKLEEDMDINKQYWDDRTILELFDKLKVSNNVVTSLLQSLRVFVKSKPHY